jgi:hypothetical protein
VKVNSHSRRGNALNQHKYDDDNLFHLFSKVNHTLKTTNNAKPKAMLLFTALLSPDKDRVKEFFKYDYQLHYSKLRFRIEKGLSHYCL